MSIIKWRPLLEPWDDMDRWIEDVSPFHRNSFIPSVDVYQTKEAVIVEAPLAGLKPEDVKVSVENDVLTLEGSLEKKSEVEDKDYYRKEIRRGSFHRAVALPASVDSAKAEASFSNGVLKVTIPKAERAKPKTIDIKVDKQ